ncbi:hypothetical protein [Chitinophaga sp. CF418]|uniref:hypothetical protein n=1 Tax=Chitinophaga sp. CF418 TaxID=1855287 RepID=UPI00091F45B2|nr:hypothetical protein [Chitinophaga sp. CF418]SHN45106.1 hypothetical protein SAMN05216311_1193 [Chitinophaga sp. CF418]
MNFFLLDNKFLNGALIVNPDAPIDGYKFLRGELDLDAPIHFSKNMGKKKYDAIHGGDVGVQLFHNRLFEAFKSENVTGYHAIPALINLKEGVLEDYSCLVIAGRASGIDDYKGEIVRKGPFVAGGQPDYFKKGIYFDETTWDGSDIFLLDGKLFIAVTPKVKGIIEKLRMTNIDLKGIEEEEIPVTTLGLRRPELLEYYRKQIDKMEGR